MRLEEHFARVLRNVASNPPAIEDPWAKFQRRLRYARIRRVVLVGASIVAAGAIAVAAVVVTRSFSERQNPGFAANEDYTGWAVYGAKDDIHNVLFRYPPDWSTRVLNDGAEWSLRVLPTDDSGESSREPDFSLTLSRLVEPLQPTTELPGFSIGTPARADRRPYLVRETERHDGSHEIVVRINWSPPCALENPGCTIAGATLVVRTVATSDAAWQRYQGTADQISRSVTFVKFPGWKLFTGTLNDHFTTSYPPDWNVQALKDSTGSTRYEIKPNVKTDETIITVIFAKEELDPSHPGLFPQGALTRADGRPFLRSDERPESGRQATFLRISWLPYCAYETPACTTEPSIAEVSIVAPDKLSSYKYPGDWIVEALEYE
jgi:hypothetical protein